jgi:Fic family protein
MRYSSLLETDMDDKILPESLRKELHPLCSTEILAKVVHEVRSNPVVCIRDVAKAVGCSDITAQKHLSRLVRAGLAIEKKSRQNEDFYKIKHP